MDLLIVAVCYTIIVSFDSLDVCQPLFAASMYMGSYPPFGLFPNRSLVWLVQIRPSSKSKDIECDDVHSGDEDEQAPCRMTAGLSKYFPKWQNDEKSDYENNAPFG
jgi:hypothetical protein